MGGDVVVRVDGGGVTFLVRDAGEVTVTGRRMVHLQVAALGPARLVEILHAGSPTTEGLAEEIGLTPAEEARLEALSDAVSWALLDGWSDPGPVPATVDAVAALPGPLRAALAEACAGPGARLLADAVGLPWPG